MKILTITNQKGGTGKTTTAAAILAGLHQRGFKVLGIDLDPQMNLTYAVGADGARQSILGVLTGEVKLPDAIQKTREFGDFIPGSRYLSNAGKIIDGTGAEYRLKEAFQEQKLAYDFIIIDTPPTLGILTINALTACHEVIVPVQASIFDMQGVIQLQQTIAPVRKYTNPAIHIAGILPVRYNPRLVISRSILESLQEEVAPLLGTEVFQTTIREGVVVKEASYKQQSLLTYAPDSAVAQDYQRFMEELLKVVD